jgi:hypothetical protein
VWHAEVPVSSETALDGDDEDSMSQITEADVQDMVRPSALSFS